MPPPDATTPTGSTTSSLGRKSQVQAAGAAPGDAIVVDGLSHSGGSSSLQRNTDIAQRVIAQGGGNRVVASNTTLIPPPARPTSVCKFRSSGANLRMASGGLSYSGDSSSIQRPTLGPCRRVGAAMPQSVVQSPITAWADRISGQCMDQPGPTFLLTRSSREPATEGVMVPSAIISQGISNRLDFADAFDDSRR